MVPLVPKVAALYTVKGVVLLDPLPKMLLPAGKLFVTFLQCLLNIRLQVNIWCLDAYPEFSSLPVAVMPPVLVRRPATVAAACRVVAALTVRVLLLLVPRTVLP